MSMIFYLRRVSAGDLNRLMAAPELIESLLYGEEVTAPDTGRTGGLLARLFKRQAPMQTFAASGSVEWDTNAEEDEVDLDKTWHGLHYLFTGTAWEGEAPANALLSGGEEIGDVDVGYGPARALQPSEVTRFAEYISSLTKEDLSLRYDPERMMELKIYPEIWDSGEGDEDSAFEYLWDGFETLREFIVETNLQGTGIIVYMS